MSPVPDDAKASSLALMRVRMPGESLAHWRKAVGVKTISFTPQYRI